MRRLLGRFVAMATLAFLLSGLGASVAAAFDREDGAVLANRFIDDCFRSGGTAFVNTIGDEIWVTCVYPDGKVLDCRFWPEPVCTTILMPRPTDGRGGVGGPAADGEVNDNGADPLPHPSPGPGSDVTDAGHGKHTGRQWLLARYADYVVAADQEHDQGRGHNPSRHGKGKHRR